MEFKHGAELGVLSLLLFFPWHLLNCFIFPLFSLGSSSYLKEFNSHSVTTLVAFRVVPLFRSDILNYPFLSESSSNIHTFQACHMMTFCTTPFLLSFFNWFTTAPLSCMTPWSSQINGIEALCILVKFREGGGGKLTLREVTPNLFAVSAKGWSTWEPMACGVVG